MLHDVTLLIYLVIILNTYVIGSEQDRNDELVADLQKHFHRALEEAFFKETSVSDKKLDVSNHHDRHKVVNGDDSNILVMRLALPLDDFLLLEKSFLHDIESHMNNAFVRCQLDNSMSNSVYTSMVDLYCFYLPATFKAPVTFVPIHKLERLLISGNMRGFLQKYNVTKFFKKSSTVTGTPIMASAITQQYWFPIALGVVTFLLVVATIVLIYMCCRRNKDIREGDIEKPVSFPTKKNKKPSFISSSPIKGGGHPGGRNSFSASPRKTFAYSPQKNSAPPIFSFTSPQKYTDKVIYPSHSPPQKYTDKVIYPSHSPMETASPFHVQPKVNLLYPLAATPNNRKWSANNTTVNSSEKSKSLYQSRMGSSASLIIDLSPKSPVHNYSIAPHESPTEEILLRKSRCLSYHELQRIRNNDKELHEEYWSIPPNTVSRKDSQMRFSLKNRYPDILPNSRSMVRLKTEDKSSILMNANFITGSNGLPNQFIATQGPLACTIADFWSMVWQFNCSILVMITKLKEKNKEKCVQYWPTEDTMSQQIYGDIIVTCDSEIERDGYKITTLYASQKGSEETRKITHFWFTTWPDHKVPKEYSQVISLMKDVRQLQRSENSPIVIHCSAGRGRTGCFIGLQLGMEQIDECNEVDILRIVSKMRIERGGLVDKDTQYIFLYKTLYEYWTSKVEATCSTPFPTATTPFLVPTSPFTPSGRVFENVEYIEEGLEEIEDGMDTLEPKKFHFQGFIFND